MLFSLEFTLKFYSTDMLVKLFTTQLTSSFVGIAKDIISGKQENLKFVLYSGHDSNVLPFMMAYNLTSSDCLWHIYVKKYKPKTASEVNQESKKLDDPVCNMAPDFASSFIWELNQNTDDNGYYIRTLFDGTAVSFCPDGKEVGADKFCPFEDFVSYTNQHLILNNEDYDPTCGSLEFQTRTAKKVLYVGVYIIGSCLLITIITVIFMAKYKKDLKQIVEDQKKIIAKHNIMNVINEEDEGEEGDEHDANHGLGSKSTNPLDIEFKSFNAGGKNFFQ